MAMGKSKSDEDRFNLSGPCNLKAVEWSNKHHKRAVVASLVQGVYVMEADRQKGRQGPHALAPPWWESFDFDLQKPLIDPADSSLFGAVFEYKNPVMLQHSDGPTYIVAFRGTMWKRGSAIRDVMLNIMSYFHTLHTSSRFEQAMSKVKDLVGRAGEAKLWLAGHSLGSALAMLVGKNMVWGGHPPLETHLFNPPFLSTWPLTPVERFNSSVIKDVLWHWGSMANAGVTAVATAFNKKPLSDASFLALSKWLPNIYVNPSDAVSSGYIGYFGHRKKMEANGLASVDRIAMQNSAVSAISSALGMDSKPLDVLPSAYVHVRISSPLDCPVEAHNLDQWWNFRIQVRLESYKFPS